MEGKKIAIVVASFPAISETFIINHIVEMIKQGNDITIFSDKFNKSGMVHKSVQEYDLINKTVYRPDPGTGLKRLFRIALEFLKYIRSSKILLRSFSNNFYGDFGKKGYFFFEILPFLKKKFRQFDIIHAHFGNVGNKVAMLRDLGLLKGKFFCTFYGHDINDIRQIETQSNYKQLEKQSDAIMFVTNDLMDKYKRLTNSTKPLYTIPSNINQDLFVVKDFLNTNSNIELNLITVGRLIDWKGQHLVLKALKQINQKTPDIKLKYHIVGEGDEEKNLKQLVKDYNIENIVVFWGSQSHTDVNRHLQKADLFILFGLTDKYGNIDAQANVIQEAQAVGLPVIVSNAGGLPEGIINNITGFVVKENSIEELSEKILYFYHNRKKIIEMGTEGVRYIEKKYSNQIIFEKLNHIYASV